MTALRRVFISLGVCLLSGSSVFAQNANEQVYRAIRNNDLAALRSLVNAAKSSGASNSDAPNSNAQTPLMLAAGIGTQAAMELLLDAGEDANASGFAGTTALHWAVSDKEKMRLLLDHGADVNAQSAIGRTPLIVAAG